MFLQCLLWHLIFLLVRDSVVENTITAAWVLENFQNTQSPLNTRLSDYKLKIKLPLSSFPEALLTEEWVFSCCIPAGEAHFKNSLGFLSSVALMRVGDCICPILNSWKIAKTLQWIYNSLIPLPFLILSQKKKPTPKIKRKQANQTNKNPKNQKCHSTKTV